MHPDKICDRISDAVLDACLSQDPNSRVAIETMGGHGIITITGELTTKAIIDIREIAKTIVGDKYGVQVNVVQQSPEISQGVDAGGAGDQGIMIGYATSETPELLPLEVVLSRSLCRFIYDFYPYDGKTQVTVDDSGLKPRVDSIVCSWQNVEQESLSILVRQWSNHVNINKDFKLHANPAGDWNIGGFEADTGVIGRKLAVDNYGPTVPIGGGAFSGKDPSKVDRSAAYIARRIAVDYLKSRNASEVYVRLAYAIGYDQPVEATVVIDGKSESVEGYNLTPNGIINYLKLRQPIYSHSAEFGHFGNGFEWDKL